jgi:hypothetical protein
MSSDRSHQMEQETDANNCGNPPLIPPYSGPWSTDPTSAVLRSVEHGF